MHEINDMNSHFIYNVHTIPKNIGRNPIVDCERNGEIEKNRKK